MQLLSWVCLTLLVLPAFAAEPGGVPGEGLAGHWQGALQAGPTKLRLALHVERDAAGYTATLDSLDQGAFGIPISTVALDGRKVTFTSAALNARYEGELSDDGSRIDGTWSQGMPLELVLHRALEAPKLNRPQEPTGPLPYDAAEVTIPHDAAGIALAGTLTLPRGAGPHPAVVLVSGSGPQDRDEMVMGHRPFLILADDLTRRGIAVLRYDDRGVGKSQGEFWKATQADFAGDARAAVAYLRTRDDIDAGRIGILGHSEGGLVAPRIAAEDDGVAFIVLVAGVGVPMGELLDRQTRDLMVLTGAPRQRIDEQLALRRELERIIREGGDTPQVRAEALRLAKASVADLSDAERAALGVTDALLEANIGVMFTPWYRELCDYDPRPWLVRVACPVLAVNGDLDRQVAADDNLGAIRAALAAGRNPPATIVKLPGLNHLLQPATTGGIEEYATIETTIDPAALALIGEWIAKQAAAASD